MCDEFGVMLDDGTISRLEEDRYFITTTTGNIDFVHQQLQLHSIHTGWDVHIANVTSGFGSINLAGPKAREVFASFPDCDLSPGAFPYMSCKEATIGDVTVFLTRLGFVGELSWEIHCPAESAETLWRALLERGREFSILPFGVEAQRLLRLEKLHVIIGVDTDAVSNPYEAGLGWTTKLSKEDFIGRAELAKAFEAPARQRLVGFLLPGSEVPPDGAAVVYEGRSAGRVTSSRYSWSAGATIGLAWVQPSQAQEGSVIQVRMDGKLLSAKVTNRPFYDPEGVRLRA
jgi:sarcosine oxidase subunit alpha